MLEFDIESTLKTSDASRLIVSLANSQSNYKNFLDELLIKYDVEIINDKNIQFDEKFHELVNQVIIEENDDQSKHNQICKTLQIGLKINGEIYKKQKVDVATQKSNIGLLSFEDEESIIDYIISNPEASI
jgi:molecular chaperone GrpE (heat shock protein)